MTGYEFDEVMNKISISKYSIEVDKFVYEYWLRQNLQLKRAKTLDKYIIIDEAMSVYDWEKDCYKYYHFNKVTDKGEVKYYADLRCKDNEL